MKYNFNIILSGQMEAKTELELVSKLNRIVNENTLFKELAKVFDIKVERESIEGEEDEFFMEKISEDFNIKIEERETDFYGIKKIDEMLSHSITRKCVAPHYEGDKNA